MLRIKWRENDKYHKGISTHDLISQNIYSFYFNICANDLNSIPKNIYVFYDTEYCGDMDNIASAFGIRFKYDFHLIINDICLR